MTESFHYPPEVFDILVETIPLLCRSKKGVILFFRGAGVPEPDLASWDNQVEEDRESVNKYQIARGVIEAINSRGDNGLAARREIIKRVVEFEEFSTCWPTDQLKAKGLVSDLRRVVNVKDSFTRMQQERDSERQKVREQYRVELAATSERKAKLESVRSRLFNLFAMADQPNARGKQLESVLNDLFRAYGILVKEDFRRKDPDSSGVLEQIDGVILLDGVLHLVEMKWLKDPVGIDNFAPHLVRLFTRANASGIFISSSGFTDPVIKECTNVLSQRTMFLCTLEEVVRLLQREDDLLLFLRRKSQAAILERKPFLELLE